MQKNGNLQNFDVDQILHQNRNNKEFSDTLKEITRFKEKPLQEIEEEEDEEEILESIDSLDLKNEDFHQAIFKNIEEDEEDEEDEEEEEEEDLFSSDEEDVSMNKNPKKKKKLSENEQAALYQAELDDEFYGKKKRKSREKKIPENIRSLIGEANNYYASSKIDEAVEVCSEIIRLQPKIRDPYIILGTIYEELGELQKAIDCFIIGALLEKDIKLWERLARMAYKNGRPEQSIFCYTKILKYKPNDFKILFERTMIYEDLKNIKKAIEGFSILFSKFPSETSVCDHLTRLYYEIEKYDEAIEVLEEYMKCTTDINETQMNYLCELYILRGNYNKVISIIQDLITIERPFESLKYELRVKFGIAQAYLGYLIEAENIFDNILNSKDIINNFENYLDIYWDIADLYHDIGEYQLSLPLLEKLLNTSHDHENLWFRLGNCYKNCEQDNEAINYYKKVLQVVPQFSDAKIALLDLLKKNDIEKAIEIVENEDDLILKVKKALLYHNIKNYNEFLNICLPIIEIINNKTIKRRKGRGINIPPLDTWENVESQLGIDDAFDLIIMVCEVLTIQNKTIKSIEIIKNTINSKKIKEENKIEQLRTLYVKLSYSIKNYDDSCETIRQMILEDPSNFYYWNLFNSIISLTENFSSNQKYLVRLYKKYPNILPISMILANLNSIRGSHRFGVALYLSLFKTFPKDPLINLCIGVSFLNLSMNRRCANRHKMIILGFSFLNNYFEINQNKDEEINYNLARAFQSFY
eukprot:gene6052-10053_t